MQKIFVLLSFTVLVIYNNCTAQNYQPFYPHLGSNFALSGDHSFALYGVRFDSSAASGADSIFYTYHTFEDTSLNGGNPFNCIFTNRGKSWIGSEMIVRSNGNYLFNNQFNDSINIQSLADSGSEWVFYKFASDTFLTATISSVINMPYNNYTDSVKVITLNKKDSKGTVLSSPWNGQTIWLSKKHGLLKTPAFYAVPYDSSSYLRYYFPEHYSKAWYANQDVGDEIDITTESTGSGFYNTYADRCIGKQYNADSSKVTYTMLEFNDIDDHSGHFKDTIYTFSKTVTVVTDTTPLLSDNVAWPTTTPLQPKSYFDTCLLTVYTTPGVLLDSCSNGYFSYYFEFCGSEFYSYYGILDLYDYDCRSQMEPSTFQTLDFYKKDGIACGSSYILGLNEVKDNSAIKVYPNPASDIVYVSLNDNEVINPKISLTSIYGASTPCIITLNSSITGATINIRDLPDGLYILQLNYGNKIVYKKIVKVSS